MNSDTADLVLVDGDTAEQYHLKVSVEDFNRAMENMSYAARMLEKHKKSLEDPEEQGAHLILSEGSSSLGCGDESGSNDSFRWPDEAIKALIQYYIENESLIVKGNLTHKKFWLKTSDLLKSLGHNVTSRQCRSKFAGLKNTYKSVKLHNNKSGSDHRKWPYFDLLDELFGARPIMQPLSILDSSEEMNSAQSSSSNAEQSSCSKRTAEESPCSSKRSKSDVASGILERLEANAELRKRIHEDQMKRQDRLIDVLEKLANK